MKITIELDIDEVACEAEVKCGERCEHVLSPSVHTLMNAVTNVVRDMLDNEDVPC